MIHTAFFIVFTVLSTILFSVLAIISGPLTGAHSRVTNGIIRMWARSVLVFSGVKVQAKGKENIDRSQYYVFMSNHLSNFDILALTVAIPVTVRFIAKKELFRIPIFGWGMQIAGMIKIDRGNSRQARKIIDKAVDIVRSGVSVIIFPEGTRSPDGKLQEFKKGGFVLALKGKIPIVPVVIQGSREIMKKKSLRLHKGRVFVNFLQPISTEPLDYENRKQVIAAVREQIKQYYQ
ncbi:MAG: 1-acylglycerol-3-phosphate O-acyltransferase [Caldithrix sp.]|nr:1-acylglycerol-3-phosphate O-acyltransferase [Caldithrix sp.]